MKRLLPPLLASAAVLAGLVLVDYPNWLAQRADQRLSRGDAAGAVTAWGKLEKLPGHAPLARFNRGVALCRMGNYSAALQSFDKSAAGGDRALRSRALYNAGTVRVRIAGEPSTAAGRAQAVLRDAVADLQQCLALEPSDAAAAANLKLAQGRLVALARADAPQEGKKPAAEPRQEAGDKKGEKRETAQQPEKGGARPGKASERQQEGGKRRESAVDRKEALRMLDQAKGREAMRSARAASGGKSAESRPEKDW